MSRTASFRISTVARQTHTAGQGPMGSPSPAACTSLFSMKTAGDADTVVMADVVVMIVSERESHEACPGVRPLCRLLSGRPADRLAPRPSMDRGRRPCDCRQPVGLGGAHQD